MARDYSMIEAHMGPDRFHIHVPFGTMWIDGGEIECSDIRIHGWQHHYTEVVHPWGGTLTVRRKISFAEVSEPVPMFTYDDDEEVFVARGNILVTGMDMIKHDKATCYFSGVGHLFLADNAKEKHRESHF